MTRLLVTFLAALLQLPPANVPGAQAQQAQGGSIEGVILRSDTGEPIPLAQVTVTRVVGPGAQPTPPPAAPANPAAGQRGAAPAAPGAPPQAPPAPPVLTDNRGRFIIKNLPPGSYRLAAGRNGFARQEYGQRSNRSPGATITVAAGQEVKEISLRLIPAGAVAGRVTDDAGRPMASVTVQLLRSTYTGTGKRNFQPAVTAKTNDLGEYRLYWISPGSYYLNATTEGSYIDSLMQNVLSTATNSARAQDPSGASAAAIDALMGKNSNEIPETGFQTTFYPGTTNSTRALPINVAAGTEFRAADIVLSKQLMFRIQGRVADARSPRPPAIAIVQMVVRGSEQTTPPKTGSYDPDSGTFEFREITPGEYTVLGIVPGTGGNMAAIAMASAQVDVVGADIENVSLTARPGQTVTGRLSVDGSENLSAIPVLDRVRVRLIPASEAVINVGQPATVAQDGTFTLENVAVGRYRVGVVGAGPNFYTKMARSGGSDVLLQPWSLTGEQQAVPVEIVVSPNAGEVSGTILDRESKPVASNQVVLIPDRQRDHRDLFRTAVSDQTGLFRFQGVPPGEYRLYSWDDMDPLAHNNEEILRQYEAQAVTANVSEGAKVQVNVRLIPVAQ